MRYRPETKLLLTGMLVIMSLLSAACGSGPILIDVDTPVNQVSPFAVPPQAFSETLTTTSGACVFFQFDPLNPLPTSISDLSGGSSIVFPDQPADPDNVSYDVSAAPLDPDTFYRVTMFGSIDPAGCVGSTASVPKYQSLSDCPLKLSLGDENNVHLCLGVISATETPLCTDLLPFSSCPGL